MEYKNVLAKAPAHKFLKRLDIQFFGRQMTDEERQLRQEYKAQYDAALVVNASKPTKEQREEAMNNVRDAKAALDAYLELQGMQPTAPVNFALDPKPEDDNVKLDPKAKGHADFINKQDQYVKAFFNALRGNDLSAEDKALMLEVKNAMTEGVDKDGGFIVPKDITTTINKLKQTSYNLELLVNVQSVSTKSGQRTLEKKATSTPLVEVSEMGTIPQTDQPEFEVKNYNVKKYAGFLPISNELLADTDQNLMQYLAEWFAKKSIATRNALILAQLATWTKSDLKDVNGFKKVLNVTLDPAHANAANIVTNQDGYNFLDSLLDGQGRPLLQPDPTKATGKLFLGKPVTVIGNSVLQTAAGKAPFYIGDLKEAIILWDRKQMTMDITNVGGNTWYTDSTELRAIEREQVTIWDKDAVVAGTITLPA